MAIRLEIELDQSGVPRGIKKVEDSLDGLDRKAKKTESSWSKVWKRKKHAVNDTTNAVRRFSTIIPTMLAGAGIGAMFTMGIKSGLAFTGQLETIKTQFRVIIGDADKANKMFQETLEFSARTPFQMAEVAKARKMLVAFGQDSLEALTITGDAAAAAGLKIDEMAMVMGRISAGAFGEAFMRLAETGVATREMLEGEGLVFDRGGSYRGSADQAMAAVQKIIKERFGGMMAKQANTWEGMISTMKDNWDILKGKVTQPLFDKLKPKILEMTELFQKWAESPQLDKFAQGLATAFDKLMEGGKIALQVAEWVWQFREVIGWTVVVLGTLTVAQTVLNAVMAVNPWVALIGLLAVAVGWLVKQERATGAVSKTMKQLGQVFAALGKGIWETLKGVGQVYLDVFIAMWDIAKNTVSTIGDSFRALGDGIKAVFTGDWGAVKQAFNTLKDVTVNGVTMSLDTIMGIGEGAFTQAGEAWGELAAAASAEAFSSIWNQTAGDVQEIEVPTPKVTMPGGDTSGGGGTGLSDRLGRAQAMVQQYNDWKAEQDAVQDARNQQLADAFQERWGYAFGQVMDGEAVALAMMEEGFNTFADNVLSGQMGFHEAMGSMIKSFFSDFMSASTRAASRWIFDQIRMAATHKTLEIAKTSVAVTGAKARTAAAITETAATGTEAAADTAGMAAKVTKAHAGIPFVGAIIAAAVIGAMLAAIAGAKKHRAGGLHGGGGSGVEDGHLFWGSGGEYTQPARAVNQYGVTFMDQVRTGQYNPNQGGDVNLSFNIQGGGGEDIQDAIEDQVVPVLERLVAQRRMVVA